MKNKIFFTTMSLLLALITIMMLKIHPVLHFHRNDFSNDSKYLFEMLMINKSINEYEAKNKRFPKLLKEVIITRQSLMDSFEYNFLSENYLLKNTFPIYDSIIVISKDSIRKYPYEEQDMGGN